MADLGHELTDQKLKKLEKQVAREYKTAVKEMRGKLEQYLAEDEAKRKVQEALYKAGKITKQEYSDWCYRHAMMGKRWSDMLETLSQDMVHTNEIALGIVKGEMPDIYALNANYSLYQIEHDGQLDTGLTLYNKDTANYLLGDQRQLMPKPSTRKAKQIAANKDMQWNMQKIQSAVFQGVIQGESPYDVAKRLTSVGQMNYNASVRYARTMGTSAQNAGRYESFRRAKDVGVDLKIEWQATLDGRTRHEHRLMHGRRVDVDEPFKTPDGFEIMYPADCTGDSYRLQGEIWNCRCTLLAWVKGFEGETIKSSPKMGDLSFEEWQNEKKSQKSGFTSQKSPVKIQSSDIYIPHSLGAKRAGENILDLATGNTYDLAGGTYIRNVEVFAGKGTKTPYRNADKYAEKYGVDASEWQHAKGIGTVATDDGDRDAELHWTQCEELGRIDMFVKEWLE